LTFFLLNIFIINFFFNHFFIKLWGRSALVKTSGSFVVVVSHSRCPLSWRPTFLNWNSFPFIYVGQWFVVGYVELLLSQSFIFSCVFKIAGVYCCFENQEVHLTVLMLFESEIQDWFLKGIWQRLVAVVFKFNVIEKCTQSSQ